MKTCLFALKSDFSLVWFSGSGGLLVSQLKPKPDLPVWLWQMLWRINKEKSVELFCLFSLQSNLCSGGTGVWCRTAGSAAQVVLEEGHHLFLIAHLDCVSE